MLPNVTSDTSSNVLHDANRVADPARILLVADDATSSCQYTSTLWSAGFSVRVTQDAHAGLLAAGSDWQPDLVVVDLLLPRSDCYAIVRAFRATYTVPVLLVLPGADRSAVRHEIVDVIVARPMEPAVLLREARRLLGEAPRQPTPIVAGGLRLMLESKTAEIGSERLHLTRDEFDVLARLAMQPGKPVERARRIQALAGFGRDADPRLVDVHLVRLMVRLSEDDGLAIARTSDPPGFVLHATSPSAH